MIAPPIRHAVIEDMMETLDCSDAQRQAAAAAFEAYQDAWTDAIAAIEDELPPLERSVADGTAPLGLLFRAGLEAIDGLESLDEALFLKVEDTLSDSQVTLATVWRDSMRGRWHAASPAAWRVIPDPLSLIPPSISTGDARRTLLQDLATPIRRRADRCDRAFGAFSRRILEACSMTNSDDTQRAIHNAVAEADAAWARIAEEVRRDVASALRTLSPLQVAWARAQWLQLDGPPSYDDLAASSIMEWIQQVDQHGLSTTDRQACVALILDALQEIEDIDRRLDAGGQTAEAQRPWQDQMLAIARDLEAPIAARVAASEPFDAAASDPSDAAPDLPWFGLQVRPLTRAQRAEVAQVLGLTPQAITPHADAAARAITHDAAIAAATPHSRDATSPAPRPSLDEARKVFSHRKAALARVKSADAAFLEATGAPPHRRQLALHLIDGLRLQPPARPIHPDDPVIWSQKPARFNVVTCAVRAGLDLDDPVLVDALCHAAETMHSAHLIAGEARTLQMESNAAWVPINDGMYGPNESMKVCNEMLVSAQVAQKAAAIEAVESVEAALDARGRAAFRVAVAESLWPRFAAQMDRARAHWHAAPAERGPTLEADFATLVGAITDLQQTMADRLIDGMRRPRGDAAGRRTLDVHALYDEQRGLVDAWLSTTVDTAAAAPD
jgi:hypothetical protein